MAKLPSTQRYHAFVLRLWQEKQHAPWRIFVQPATTGERLAFASLEDLLVYLQRVCEGAGADDDPAVGG